MGTTLDYSDAPDRRRRRLVAAVHVAALAFPLLAPVAVYAAYLLAWVKLGARPVPSLNDPADVLGAAYYISGLPLLFMPAGWMLAALSVGLARVGGAGRARTVARAMTLLALWIGAVALLRADPGRVVDWWKD